MIPKIIHYCWFGGKPLPELAKKCIASWKKYCPDYEIIEWNEKNFDLNICPYVREAYDAKKYAFVTDFVRLWAMKTMGGIYMDSDVEVLKPLDNFLTLPAFSGFESSGNIPTGIMASEKAGIWVTWMLTYYDDRHFLNPDGTPDTTNNVTIITRMMTEKGFVTEERLQDFKGMITMFPHDYFCPKDYATREIRLTPNSYAIHHFNASWLPWRERTWMHIRDRFGKIPAFLFWNVTKSTKEMWHSICSHIRK